MHQREKLYLNKFFWVISKAKYKNGKSDDDGDGGGGDVDGATCGQDEVNTKHVFPKVFKVNKIL